MSLTHIAYARQIEEHIALKYGVNLRHFSLIYGSIKPDASILFGGKAPHYINLSLDMLCESANILINATDSLRELETRAFSRELGVIMHYVTDYFCRVHNDINGIKHSEYRMLEGHLLPKGERVPFNNSNRLNRIEVERWTD